MGEIVMVTVDGTNYKHRCKNASFLFQIVTESEQQPFTPWDWAEGDTIEHVFRDTVLSR